MNRDRRVNAGNRMSKLLDEEETCQDEFYKVNYGGFEETETDNEYEAEDEGEDIVDSDFSIDENDEPVSENDDEAGSQAKRRGVLTKAYKEPKPTQKPREKPTKKSPAKPKPRVRSTASTSASPSKLSSVELSERKSIRKSTAAKSAATLQRIKVRDQEQKKKVKKPKEEEWVPTQEELLEEAKITELENIESLEKYQKLETEKKIKRPTKRIYSEPVIRYESIRLPLIEDIHCKPTEADNEELQQRYYSRTFISILNDPNDVTYNQLMPTRKRLRRRQPPPQRCCISQLPAKYLDPVTRLPYHSMRCFRLIRDAYAQQLRANGDPGNALVAQWLSWYARQKGWVGQAHRGK